MPDTCVITLADKLSQFSDHWNPRIAAHFNGNEVRLAKLKGEFEWHAHVDTDELFLVLEGSLTLQFRDGTATLNSGDLLVVPAGTEHKPVAEEECHVMFMDKAGEPNTGANETSALTRKELETI